MTSSFRFTCSLSMSAAARASCSACTATASCSASASRSSPRAENLLSIACCPLSRAVNISSCRDVLFSSVRSACNCADRSKKRSFCSDSC
jgi:hypothetical protein